MKISGYKVLDASGTIGGNGTHVQRGQLRFNLLTNFTERGWEDISIRKITNIIQIGAVALDVAAEYDITFATAPIANENFTVTVSYGDSRQRVNKSFKFTTILGSTVTKIAVAIRDAINASSAPFTASNSSGVLTITADVAGAGYEPVFTAGTDSSTTTVTVQSYAGATNDAVKTTAGFYAGMFSNVLASDFGSQTEHYDAAIVEYIDAEESEPKGKAIKRYAALFNDAPIALTAIAFDVNGSVLANPTFVA